MSDSDKLVYIGAIVTGMLVGGAVFQALVLLHLTDIRRQLHAIIWQLSQSKKEDA